MPLLILAATSLVVAGFAAETKTDTQIFAGREANATASFLVVLREQADLSGAAGIEDRNERRRFVFETLRAHAEKSQAPLRERLDGAGVRYRPHFLVNMIEVEGDRATALDLAGRADVSRVAGNRAAALSHPGPSAESSPRSGATVEPNLQKIRAPELWSRAFTGQGVVIGDRDRGHGSRMDASGPTEPVPRLERIGRGPRVQLARRDP